jgi:diguanylate cyclase (GGDEF)-like protein/PAS domain S-box-containing protein
MRIHWRQGILIRSAGILLASFLITGAVAVVATLMVTRERAHTAANEHLKQLVATVESTVQVACFANDAKLAEEVAVGLLKNGEVRSVIIETDDVGGARTRLAQAGNMTTPSGFLLSRAIHSPFVPASVIGHVEIAGNDAEIESAIDREVHFAVLQIAGLLGFAALSVGVVMLLYIIRPIKAMSDGLHHMDPMLGEQLARPAHHAETELGRLVDDINALAANLVSAVEEERTLRDEYHAIFENAETGIFIAEANGTLTSWNPAFGRLMGITPDTAEGVTHLRQLPWANVTRLADLTRRCRTQGMKLSDDLALNPPGAETRWVNVVLTPIGGNLIQGVVHDVTGHKQAEDDARQMAVTDPLTGVRNRMGMEDGLATLIREAASGFALFMLDLDNFRRVNEGYGLPTGDAVLKGITARLRQDIKAGDCIARLGANRFIIAMPGIANAHDLEKIAARLLDVVRPPFHIGDIIVQVNASLGMARYPEDSISIPELLRDAELALVRAKSSGGDMHVMYETGLSQAAELRRQRENELREAVHRGEFQLYYQPIIDLRENRMSGVEALIRWLHPTQNVVPPDLFIPLAEEIGLINEIGLWALDSACGQIAEWRARGIGHYISLNVSGMQIPDGLEPRQIAAAVRHHGIPADALALEITEGILMSDLDKARAWLDAVRQIGCRVYLDDFGTGYSSLSYLKRFPVHTLKVDKSFVRDMHHDGSDHALVAAIVAMARSLSLDVVAEGVENMEQLAMLRAMGCHYAQGYHFSRPCPIEAIAGVEARITHMLSSAARVTIAPEVV